MHDEDGGHRRDLCQTNQTRGGTSTNLEAYIMFLVWLLFWSRTLATAKQAKLSTPTMSHEWQRSRSDRCKVNKSRLCYVEIYSDLELIEFKLTRYYDSVI